MHFIFFALIRLSLHWACLPTGTPQLIPNHHALSCFKIGFEGKGGVNVHAPQSQLEFGSLGYAFVKVELFMVNIASPFL